MSMHRSGRANVKTKLKGLLASAGMGAAVVVAAAAWCPSARAQDVIRFGADFTQPPGQVMIDSKMAGADYELCSALAKQIGVEAQWTNIEFGTLIAALNAKRIDAACSSVDITPARQQVVSFVPYRIDSEGAAVQVDNPKHVTRPDDICGLDAAELLGSVYQTVVQQQSDECSRAGKQPVNLKTFNTTADAFAQLMNGRADVVVGDAPIMAYYVSKAPAKTAMAFEGVKPMQVGIALRKSDDALKQKFEAALSELQADGTYAKVLAKWNLQAGEMKK